MSLFLRRYFSFQQLFFYGLVGIVTGLVCSRFLLSVGTFTAAGAWLLSGNPLQKFKLAFSNKWVYVLIALYCFHAISMLWSSEWDYGLKDLRIKLPLFIFPILLAGWPLSTGRLKQIFNVYLVVLLIISLYYFLSFFILHPSVNADYRAFNKYDSHIRYGLQLIFGILICVHYFLSVQSKYTKWYYISLALFFVVTLYILKSFNAYFIFIVILFFILKRLSSVYTKFRILFFTAAFVSVACVIFGAYIFYDEYVKIAQNNLDQFNASVKTKQGHTYVHYPEEEMSENGYRTMLYLCDEEMIPAWQIRSQKALKTKDHFNTMTYYTLIRYLTSKGLRKDAEGVNALSNSDVLQIENACANYKYCQSNKIRTRVHEFWYEIKEYELMGNADGHSITLRFKFWETALHLIQRNPLFGTGIGDYKQAFLNQYEIDQSNISVKNRLRSHNQLLSICAALGVFGGLVFMFSLFYPLRAPTAFPWIYHLFLLAIFISFFGEDTLETQIGVTLYGFWNSALLFTKVEDQSETISI